MRHGCIVHGHDFLDHRSFIIIIIYKSKIDFYFKFIFIRIYISLYKILHPNLKITNILYFDTLIIKFIIKYFNLFSKLNFVKSNLI